MRNLKNAEHDLIMFMLKDDLIYKNIAPELLKSKVEDMDDGCMGSIRFLYEDDKIRRFGKEIASVSILDIDEVLVSFAINVDENGDLFELDVFKGDFSRLKQFPIAPYKILPPPQKL